MNRQECLPFKALLFFTIFFVFLFSPYLPAQTIVPVSDALKPVLQEQLPPRTGFIPPRMDFSHLSEKSLPENLRSLAPPPQFDWRDSGFVTTAKNQSSCGACYAFAAAGNFESKVLLDGGAAFDFSENNIKECNFRDRSCLGGNFWDVANLLSQKGSVLESCDGYVASNTTCNTGCPYIKTMLGWSLISEENIPVTADLQTYIQTYGPVYTSMYAGNGDAWYTEMGTYDGSYVLYYAGTEGTNHAVLIVGWADTLSHAGGTGAWIVKNSWGSSWGDNGFFYIAYGSANIGRYSSYIDNWQDYNTNEEILYYDEAGHTLNYGYNNAQAWALAKYTPTSNVYLNRVEFWTNDQAVVDVYIYDDFDGSNLSTLIASKITNTFELPGYHSVALDSPPEITNGNTIYAVIRVTNNSYGYPITCDNAGSYETATTYMWNGSNPSWYDLGGVGVDNTVRIRVIPTFAVSVDDDDNLLPYEFELKNNYPNPFNPWTNIEYYLGDEGEKLVITRPSIVFIPAGMTHCPLTYTRVDKPIIFQNVAFTTEYLKTMGDGEQIKLPPGV